MDEMTDTQRRRAEIRARIMILETELDQARIRVAHLEGGIAELQYMDEGLAESADDEAGGLTYLDGRNGD